MSEKGRQLDLTSASVSQRSGRAKEGKRFLGVHFACCDVYTRIYPNHTQTAYVGNCPRCAKRIQLAIGTGGTNSRFFTAQ